MINNVFCGITVLSLFYSCNFYPCMCGNKRTRNIKFFESTLRNFNNKIKCQMFLWEVLAFYIEYANLPDERKNPRDVIIRKCAKNVIVSYSLQPCPCNVNRKYKQCVIFYNSVFDPHLPLLQKYLVSK